MQFLKLKREKFTKKNIKVIRPGFGIQPFFFEKLINKKSPYNISSETPLNKSLLKELKFLNENYSLWTSIR